MIGNRPTQYSGDAVSPFPEQSGAGLIHSAGLAAFVNIHSE